MIKKLLSVVALSIATSGAVNAQSQFVAQPAEFNPNNTSFNEANSAYSQKTAAALVSDTLWYFYKKHIYRNPSTSTGFYAYTSPQTGTFAVTHMGSRFNNSGTVVVSGLEGIAARKASSANATVTAKLYLCNVVANVPVFPPLDSVTAAMTGTAGVFIGGNFLQPKIVTGDFAVLIRANYVLGDTIRPYLNNANTASSTTTLTACKYGEGFGFVRYSGTFTTTTGFFTNLPTVGATSDVEFMVAPRVSYSLVTNHSVTQPTVCTNTPLSYSNTTSAWATNRQFNYNQFYPYWTPYSNTVTVPPTPNQIYTWNFGDGSAVSNVVSPSKTYTAAGAFNGTLTTNVVKLSAANSLSVLATVQTDVKNWAITSSICSLGLKNTALNAGISVYPNPAINGKITIANLEGANTITVYNLLGSVISTQSTTNSNFTIDLSNQAAGNYFVRITDSNSSTKTVKVIN